MAKTGRNDRCPCGSGEKYKNCCLRKDQEAANARNSLGAWPTPTPRLSPPPVPPPQKVDPHEAALKAVSDQFHKADYAGRLALFWRLLDEKELLDDENSFEMLNERWEETARRGERDRFDEMVRALRERLPDVYARNAGYLVANLIENAVSQRRFEALPALASEMAEHAEDHIELYQEILATLAYHGQLDVLLATMRQAWPSIEESEDIEPEAIDDIAERAADWEIFACLEESSAPDATDPILIDRAEFFLEGFRPNTVIEFVDLVSGKRTETYALEEFDLREPEWPPPLNWEDEEEEDEDDEDEEEDDDEDEDEEDEEDDFSSPGRQRLYHLSLEFLGQVRRELGVPYTKGELARLDIVDYLLTRADEELEPRRPAKNAKPAHPLCPDPKTLQRYLARAFHPVSLERHAPAALFELLPAWLRFLQSRNLLSDAERRQTIELLRPLSQRLHKRYQNELTDTNLRTALANWGNDPAPPQSA